MWETSLEAGARLHSGSWGFPDDPCTVDEASVSFDRWAYEVRRWSGAIVTTVAREIVIVGSTVRIHCLHCVQERFR